MDLSKLPKITKRSKKRVGRGYGSGKGGHTAGRGTKGQRSREDIPLLFEGSATGASLIKRLPFLRGKGKNKPHKPYPVIINIGNLNRIPKNSRVDLPILIKYRLVDEDKALKCGVKILGKGLLNIPLAVVLPCSISAQEKIKKAGGSVVLPKNTK